MREQPHHTDLLTKEFFEEYYIDKKMSYPQIKEMLKTQGYNIHNGTLHKYAKRVGIGRGASEARRNWDSDSLDYNKTYIDEEMLKWLDGLALGDGGISPNHNSGVARLSCGVEYEEFCKYLMHPFLSLGAKVKKRNSPAMNQGFIFSGATRFHPEIYEQYLRWYPEVKEGIRGKQPPDDVRITKESVQSWFLGDGSLSVTNNTIGVQLSTDGFIKERNEMLVDKLRGIGIKCHRNNENRIKVNTKGIPAFFDLIGRKSPISCYNYKFDRVPEFRFTSKRMKEVADELNISYDRLSYFVKIGKVETYRLSKNGRPRFLPEHIKRVKELINSGELY